jgi:transcriptional regulator
MHTTNRLYAPSPFRVEEETEIIAFIQANSFGIVISADTQAPYATHLPMHLHISTDGDAILYGHIASANPQVESLFDTTKDVLVVFRGAHAYVSSTWYGHPNVPTWNYETVHTYGKCKQLTEAELLHLLRAQVQQYEQYQPKPLDLDTLPEGMIAGYMKEIVGFSILISRVEASYKMSQNRNDTDYENIIKHLSEAGTESAAVASRMKTLRKKEEESA